jgi:1-deoxy-D-xylulose-5-phosphate reductoisomerase
LGSCGSVGRSVLDVIRSNRGGFEPVFLSVYSNAQGLAAQVAEFLPLAFAVASPDFLDAANPERQKLESALDGIKARVKGYNPTVVYGPQYYERLFESDILDAVVVAVTGIDGFMPSCLALRRGVKLALANKETMVAGGGIIMREAKKNRADIIPIDSEHSAIRDCISKESASDIKRIILTASGGPFLNYTAERLKTVSASDALKHPTWRMGKKISIDSATMMNKGLEIIEAMHFFGLEADAVDAVIHKESVIHSLAEFRDNSMTAVLSVPDMRVPISRALSLLSETERTKGGDKAAGRLISGASALDLIARGVLTFSAPDEKRFPCLKTARAAARAGGIMPAAMNAANKLAVEDFLAGRLSFCGINGNIERVLERVVNYEPETAADVIESDAYANRLYRQING